MPEWPSLRIRRVIFWVACAYLALVTLITIRDVLKYRATPFPQWNVEVLSLHALTPEEAEVSLRLSAPPDSSALVYLGKQAFRLRAGEEVQGSFPLDGFVTVCRYVVQRGPDIHADRLEGLFSLIAWQPYARKYWPLLLLGALGLLLLLIMAAAKSRVPGWQRMLVVSPIGSPALALQQRYREAWLCNTLQFWLAFVVGVAVYVGSSGLGTRETDIYARSMFAFVPAGASLCSGWIFQLLLAVVYRSEPEEQSEVSEARMRSAVGLAILFPIYGLAQFRQHRWKAAWGISTLGLLAFFLIIWLGMQETFHVSSLPSLLNGPHFHWSFPRLLGKFAYLWFTFFMGFVVGLPAAEASVVTSPGPVSGKTPI